MGERAVDDRAAVEVADAADHAGRQLATDLDRLVIVSALLKAERRLEPRVVRRMRRGQTGRQCRRVERTTGRRRRVEEDVKRKRTLERLAEAEEGRARADIVGERVEQCGIRRVLAAVLVEQRLDPGLQVAQHEVCRSLSRHTPSRDRTHPWPATPDRPTPARPQRPIDSACRQSRPRG